MKQDNIQVEHGLINPADKICPKCGDELVQNEKLVWCRSLNCRFMELKTGNGKLKK